MAGQSGAAGPSEDRDKGVERSVQLKVERCFFEGCIPPPVPTVPTGRPDTVQLWSEATDGQWTVPGEMEDVTIPAGEGREGLRVAVLASEKRKGVSEGGESSDCEARWGHSLLIAEENGKVYQVRLVDTG